MTLDTPPSVLVLHAWWGRTPFVLEVGERLRGEGFRVEVPDLYGAGQTTDRIDEAEALAEAADAQQMLARARASLARLEPPVGVVGFSLGAPTAIHLAYTDPGVAAVVLYYGTGSPPAGASTAASFLGHFGTHDPYEPVEDVRDLEQVLRRTGAATRFTFYDDARHWFAEPDRPEHDPAAAQAAWAGTLDFLQERLTAGPR